MPPFHFFISIYLSFNLSLSFYISHDALAHSPQHLSQSVHPTAPISLSNSLTPSLSISLLLYTPRCLSLFNSLTLYLSLFLYTQRCLSLSVSYSLTLYLSLLSYNPRCISLYLILSLFISRFFFTSHGASFLFLSPSVSIFASHGSPLLLSLSFSISLSYSLYLSFCIAHGTPVPSVSIYSPYISLYLYLFIPS